MTFDLADFISTALTLEVIRVIRYEQNTRYIYEDAVQISLVS